MDKIWIKINEFYILYYQVLASVNLIHFPREKKDYCMTSKYENINYLLIDSCG